MATKLSKAKIDHLALVFADRDGRKWAPRNPEAVVFGTKAGEKDETQKAFLSKIIDAVKAAVGFPVSTDVPDNVDGDGDGADDYNEIVGLLCATYNDLNSAIAISDDGARAAAVCGVIDSFKSQLDAMYADDDTDKAGARHSAADKQSIDDIAAAHAKIGKAVAAATKAHAAMGESLTALNAKPGDSTADAPDDSEADKAKADDNKPYGDVEYADPKNGKYPVDTEEHARAAWSYINQEKNASEYSSDELAEVKARIVAACKKFGIEISSDESKAAPAEEIEMTKEEVAALVAESVKAALAESKAEAETAKAAAAEAQAQIDAANAAAAAAKAEAEATHKASIKLARSVSAVTAEKSGEEVAKARADKMKGLVRQSLGANSLPQAF